MRKISLYVFVILFLLSSVFIAILTTEEKNESGLSVTEILGRVDSVLGYPAGELTGNMVHITPGGKAKACNIKVSVSEKGTLIVISTESRGDELKVLYNRKREDIWVFNPVINQLYNKRYRGLFDTVLSTNFFFIDIMNFPFEKKYTAAVSGSAAINNVDCIKLELTPKEKDSRYAQLTIYAGKNDYIPLKIDFHYADKKVYKTLSIGNLLKQNNTIIPMRYEMLDSIDGSTTIIEFTGYDSEKKFDKKIFIHESGGGF